MALRLTDKRGRIDPRPVEPAEATNLRAIRAAGLAVRADDVCYPLLQYAHRLGLRIECDCRGEGAEAPVNAIRRQRNGAYSLFNLRFARATHADDCAFRRRDLPPGAAAGGLHSDFVDPAAAMRADPGEDWDPEEGLEPIHRHGGGSPVETLREGGRRRAGDDVGDPRKAGPSGASQPAGGGGRACLAGWVAARDRPGGGVVPRRVGGSAVGVPVHRPGVLALRRGRAQAGGRRAGLARARRADRPPLLGRARPGRA